MDRAGLPLAIQSCWRARYSSLTQGDVTALLSEVKQVLEQWKVPVKGIISDGQETIGSAVAFVFPGVPHQLCQFHYLKDATAPLYEADRHAKAELKKQLRGVRPIERALEEHPTPENEAIRGYCLAVRAALSRRWALAAFLHRGCVCTSG